MPWLVQWLAACGPDAVAWKAARPELAFPDGAPTFAATALGSSTDGAVTVTNAGTASGSWSVVTTGPFTVDRSSLDLGAGESAVLAVTFRPLGYPDADGALWLGSAFLALAGQTVADADGDGDEAEAAGGSDCDDGDPAVYLGAPEVCGDGVDQDCAPGGDSDCDADGLAAPGDCDDTDPSVGPGHADDQDDGQDDDCDGMIDEDLLSGGELVIAEISPQDPAWVELCSVSDRTLHLGGLTLESTSGTTTLPEATVEPGTCAAVCTSAIAECAANAEVLLDGDQDRLVLTAGTTVLDAVAWDETFAWIPGLVLALDPAHLDASDNNRAGAWCVTGGTPGAPNESCGR